MTKKQIDEIIDQYFDVNGPSYRGAPVPEFDPKQINETWFADELRFKSIETIKAVKENLMTIYWISQEYTDDTEDFVYEILRWGKEVGLAGVQCHLIVESRDGDGIYNEFITF